MVVPRTNTHLLSVTFIFWETLYSDNCDFDTSHNASKCPQRSYRHSQGLQGDIHMRSAKFITTFDYDRSSWGLIERSDYCTEDMVKLQRFLCVAELIMLDMYKGNVMMEMEKNQSVSCYIPRCNKTFVWIMNKEEIAQFPQESGQFMAFGLKWKMELLLRVLAEDDERGSSEEERMEHLTARLHLQSANSKLMQNKLVSIRVTFEVMELNVRYFTTMIFDETHCHGDWGTDRVDLKQFQDLHSCTLGCFMELVDVFEDGVCVTADVEQSGHL